MPVARRLYMPALVSLAGAALVALLIYGVAALGTNRTLDQDLHEGRHPAAPDATHTLPVLDGSGSGSVAAYRGHVVLLNFWASWCEPCVVELPSLLQLHHDQPNLAILAVSIDEDPDAYSSFILHRHVDLITVRDPSESVAKIYKTEMWPETYVIDRKGVVRRKFVGAQDWSSSEVRAYLQNL